MSFKPSPYQVDVFRSVRDDDCSLIVEAVAGSGKTTTITGAVRLIPEHMRVLFCAFNKSIATELQTKLPDHVNCMTLNSMGHRAWMRHIGGRVNLNVKKTYDLLDDNHITQLFGKYEVRSVRYVVNKLVGYAKQIGMTPVGLDGVTGLVDDEDSVWHHIINHHNVEFNVKRDGKTRFEIKEETKRLTKLAIDVSREVLKMSIRQTDVIDFNDQLYMPVIYGAKFNQFDVVFVDEAQDISAIQRIMLKRSLARGGRLIAVGDPSQAIYGFRGADSESLNNIASEFNAKRLPLSISYRCPKLVVKEAQKYVAHIEANETAPEGKVEMLGVYNPKDMSVFQENDMVLCRNVAPLVQLAFNLISARKPVGILGRDIGANIVSLIEKMKANDVSDLRKKLLEWQNTEISRIQERDPDATGEYIIERADAVRTFINCSGEDTIDGIIESVKRLFSDKIEGAIILSTIHKSKGLESDRVIILDFKLLPSKYAIHEWQKIQENNLIYVAITRSMNYLGYIDTPEGEK